MAKATLAGLKSRINSAYSHSHGDITREEVARTVLTNEHGRERSERMLARKATRKKLGL